MAKGMKCRRCGRMARFLIKFEVGDLVESEKSTKFKECLCQGHFNDLAGKLLLIEKFSQEVSGLFGSMPSIFPGGGEG